MGKIVVQFEMPPPGAADVVKREIKEVMADGMESIFEWSDGLERKYDKGAKGTLFGRDTDASGNASDFGVASPFEVLDVFAPPAPGMIGMRFIREEP